MNYSAISGGNRRVEIWQEHFTEEGQAYYYNVQSDYSLWVLPNDAASSKQIQLQVQCEADDGKLYWLNETTNEITPILLLK